MTLVSFGCRNCKKIHAEKREVEKYPYKDLKLTRKKPRVWTKHSPFKSREAILQHLQDDPNPHNLYVLELMQQTPPTDQGKLYRHHIIPCHAGGKNVNIMKF